MPRCLKFPTVRAHHFKQVLVVLVCLLVFEGVYITLIREGRHNSIFKRTACQRSKCFPSHLSYQVIAERSGESQRITLCIDENMEMVDTRQDIIYLVLVNSFNISDYTLESYRFGNQSSRTIDELDVPNNKFFILISGMFSRTSLLLEILRVKFKYVPQLEFIGKTMVLSGHVYNNTTTQMELLSPPSDDFVVDGCVKDFQGATTCPNITECSGDEVPYHVRAGSWVDDGLGFMCFDNAFITFQDEEKTGGLSLLLINERTFSVEEKLFFDTNRNGDKFDAYLRSIEGHKIIIIASGGDGAEHLRESSKRLLEEHFGSAVAGKFSYRSHYVLLGQRGLFRGSAQEKLRNPYINRPVEIKGCLNKRGVGVLQPTSDIPPLDLPNEPVEVNLNVTCDPDRKCESGHVPVFVHTGFKNTHLPNACVGGQIINQTQLGRGLNFVVYDPWLEDVSQVRSFDTYYVEHDIPSFLEQVSNDSLVIAFTHDDAVRKLSPQARSSLHRLGSFYIGMLHMRDSWLIIGQKKSAYYSPYEVIEYSQYRSFGWSAPARFDGCVPVEIKGKYSLGVPLLNDKKLEYCSAFENDIKVARGDFCSGIAKWQPMRSFIVQNPNIEKSPVFKTPILVFISSVEIVAQSQLQHTKRMAGLDPKNVYVFYDPSLTNCTRLASLFGFKTIAYRINEQQKYINSFLLLSQESPDVIILEEGVMPTRYLLEYLAHLYNVYTKDDTLASISAYNHHAYLGFTSSLHMLAFRSTDTPMNAFMAKMVHYTGNTMWSKDTLIPYVSYVVVHPLTPGHVGTSPLVRSYSQGSFKKVGSQIALHSDHYDDLMERAIVAAHHREELSPSYLETYDDDGSVASVFHQEHDNDVSFLTELVASLFLSTPRDDHLVNGLYKGVFRYVSYKGIQVFLVGSRSEFAKFVPAILLA